ncbi:MAG: TonB-linked SusC/RagA family outer membrane protein [Cyclobacteriaceae bacterium]|jgi:TonB-linked SusC/RagA family outer membrane protein
MKLKFYILILALMGAIAHPTFSQDLTVKGKVTDSNGEGMPFTNVVIKGTTNGTTSNLDGYYSMSNLSAEDILLYSSIGFVPQEVIVGSQSVIDISLLEDVTSLEEVVVIGYGTTSEKELTGSVSVVKGEAIEKLNPTRIEQALQGQTPGVEISSQSGSPGGSFNIRIRGVSTNGDNKPLILVDGVVYENLGSLNPSSIESINILKDASSGIYGVRGANGVILITTKKGKKNSKPQISFSSYYGIQEASRRLPVLNATEYGIIANEAFAAGNSTPPFNNPSSLGVGTDWQDQVFEQAPIQNYDFQVRGGGETTSYSFGAGYFTQEGIVGRDKASYDRLTVNFNSNTKLSNKLSLDLITNYTGSKRKTLKENTIGSVLFNALNMSPAMTPFDSDGNYTLADGLGGEVINPLAQIENTHNDTWVNRIFGKIGLNYEIMDGLKFQSSLNFDYTQERFKDFSPETFYGAGKVFNNIESSVNENQKNFWSYTWDNVVFYEKVINEDHSIKATVGTSSYRTRGEHLLTTGWGIPNNDVAFADIARANEIRVGGARSEQFDQRLMSYFARAEYNYNYKYLFSVMARRDGSTRFGSANKFGIFTSVSAGWVMSEEDFMSDIEFINFAKMRVSYGTTGNDKIGDFRYLSSLNGEGVYVFNGNTLSIGSAPGALANPLIAWEKNKQLNVGIDIKFLNNFSLTADYFIKTTSDLLLEVPVSGLTGVGANGSGSPTANAGSVRNKGLELALNYMGYINNDLEINVGYNIATLSNNTLKLNDGVSFIDGGEFGIGQLSPTRWNVGQSIGAFYGLVADGVFQNEEEVAAAPGQTDASPGDLRYADVDGDGVWNNEKDRTFIGSPIPTVSMGLTVSLNYKNFDFSAFANGSFGNVVARNYGRNLALTNKTSYYIQRWTGAGSTNEFPRVTTGGNDNGLFSDHWLENGSYVRIKNIQLGYTFSTEILEKIGANSLRIYTAINNLHTFTDYQGYDPNVSSGESLNAGNDIGYYPQARTYQVGLNLTF